MRRRTDDYSDESYEDYEERQEEKKRGALVKQKRAVPAGEGPQLPEPVVYDQAIRSWAQQYTTTSLPDQDTKFLTIGDIRDLLFGMVPFGGVDPLEQITAILEDCGIFPTINPAFGGPVYQLNKEKEIVIVRGEDGTFQEQPVETELSLF